MAVDTRIFIDLAGQEVVLDLKSPYVCIGRLIEGDELFVTLADADLHDFRDSIATRELYVYDSARLGIRRNRTKVSIARSEIVAISRLADVQET